MSSRSSGSRGETDGIIEKATERRHVADQSDVESGGDGGSDPVPGMTRRRVVGILPPVVFIDLVGFGILIPVIPLYAKFFGANEFVGAPSLGRLSDEYGRRPILLVAPRKRDRVDTVWRCRRTRRTDRGHKRSRGVVFRSGSRRSDGRQHRHGERLHGRYHASGESRTDLVPLTEFTLPSFTPAALSGAHLAVAYVVLPEPRPDRWSRSRWSSVRRRGLLVTVRRGQHPVRSDSASPRRRGP